MDWKDLSKEEKIKKIEEILDREIRFMIHRDGGGVRLIDLLDEKKVIIAYEGACLGCPAAKTSTLAMIQEILRYHLKEEIIVVPEF